MQSRVNLEITIPPEWHRIDPIREGVGHCAAAVFGEEHRDSLAVVSAELLENAIKYGRIDDVVTLTLAHDADEVIVSVENGIDPASHHPQALERRLAWLRGFPSAYDAFIAAMEQVYALPAGTEGGLGMARVAYEGGCAISCDISRPGRVQVVARRARGAVVAATSPSPEHSASSTY